jgi:hypothetical protein
LRGGDEGEGMKGRVNDGTLFMVFAIVVSLIIVKAVLG